MEPQNELLLIDQLDKMHAGEAPARLSETLAADKHAVTAWEYLKRAVEAVEYTAICDRVNAVRRSFAVVSAAQIKPQGAVVRSLFRSSLRIAAAGILFLGLATIYKYSTVTGTSLYKEYYSSYTLGTLRGNAAPDVLEEAYKNRNWRAVVNGFNEASSKTSKSYFLAGMAEMELHHYRQAIIHFEFMLSLNGKNKDNFFQDEAEYYLAMSYLMNNETEKGVALLRKIRGNKDHLYYPLANQISGIDLKIIDIKIKR
jgi:tetratricopeptide (TPR) repeat protein